MEERVMERNEQVNVDQQLKIAISALRSIANLTESMGQAGEWVAGQAEFEAEQALEKLGLDRHGRPLAPAKG
jgi:hypothetical protein